VTVSGATGSPGTIASIGAHVTAGGAVTGLVPAQLSLTLGVPATFAPFAAGVAKDYLAQTTSTATSTGGDAVLNVLDASPVAPGHLVSGTFPLPQALQVNANGGAYAPIAATPTALKAYAGPVSNDEVTVGVKQAIGASDALRTGAYAKTLTFVLATTTPQIGLGVLHVRPGPRDVRGSPPLAGLLREPAQERGDVRVRRAPLGARGDRAEHPHDDQQVDGVELGAERAGVVGGGDDRLEDRQGTLAQAVAHLGR
jgi:hypothetical protein